MSSIATALHHSIKALLSSSNPYTTFYHPFKEKYLEKEEKEVATRFLVAAIGSPVVACATNTNIMWLSLSTHPE